MEATADTTNPILARLDGQVAWFTEKSSFNRSRFQMLKIAQIVAGALIPFASSVGAPAYVASGFGVLIVIFEGLQSLNQYQHTWISYRSTCEELKREKYLWLAKAGPYANAANANAVLAERVEAILSGEDSSWTTEMQKRDQQQSTAATSA
jgi:hypothetical protein